MPGLIGFVKQLPHDKAQKLLTEMASALEPENRFKVDLFHGEGYALGRVSLCIANPEPQPVWNINKTKCVFIEGEIFNNLDLKQTLIERGYPAVNDNNAELILHLHEEFGDNFAVQLNGAFVIAIWDELNNKLLVVNDRFGLHPFYYAQVNGGLVFGSGVRALLADPELPRKINYDAINQMLTFDHLLNNNTLLKDVHLFPQASVLSYYNDQLTIQPYWTLEFPNTYQNQSEESYIEQLIYYLRQAVIRQKPDSYKAGLMLSGGLDSRFLLALLRDGDTPSDIETFTWGIPGCDDARFAKELANKLNTRHHFFELKSDWILDLADKAVRITDGMGNIINLHALANLEDEASYAQVIYKGFMGDAMMGYALQPPFWANYAPEAERDIHLQVHTNQGVITFNPTEKKELFNDSFYQLLDIDVLDTYQEIMRRSGSSMLALQRLFFDYTQRVPRLTLTGVEMVRDRAIARMPFCDNDFVDFSLSVPPGFLFERRLIKNAFIQAFPKLAKIPNTENGLPMITCGRDVLIRSKRILDFHLKNAGLGTFANSEPLPYKDYTRWFRTVLRSWVENTLLSQQALERGYFNPDYVQQLVDEHMAGADHTLKIGALLTLEKWHMLFLD